MEKNTLKSPGYPDNYPRNMYCTYTASIPHGTVMKIYFQEFNVATFDPDYM